MKVFGVLSALLVTTLALPSVALAADSCAARMDQVLYAARFDWNPTGLQEKPSKMRIVIGTLRASSKQPVAQIRSVESPGAPSECLAVCKLKSLEKEGVLKPVALEMDCQGSGFSPLAMAASVLWGGSSSRHQALAPTIRFGTWLQGYQTAALDVAVDLYTMPIRTDRRIALNY